ncbi:uncharacterized protein LOC132645089 [Lycium barbarum]|uniref:uncharacterized protein LOC132645089 n=1 Tax=Lycium barbarum TaxID=112863 RepID=UPI00293EADBB|nr:uncharacterized protein LOC132645089 [Lycium barbarum]
MEVEEKDVTPEKLARKKFPRKLAQDPYVENFDSGTSKCIFDIKHPFMSDIDDLYALSGLAQEFVEFVEDGMNMTRRDCGVFVVVFADYFMHGKEITKDNIDIEVHRTRYGSLLWDYGRKNKRLMQLAGLKKLLADGSGGGRGNMRKSRGLHINAF